MSVQVRRRREAAAFLSTYVGAQGELLVDTTNNRVQVHDGATPNGWPAAGIGDLPGRNVGLNTNFTINQRGYASGTALAAGVYAHDRHKAGANGCTYTFTQAVPDTSITITVGTLIQAVDAPGIYSTAWWLTWTGTAQARVWQGSASGNFSSGAPFKVDGVIVNALLVTGLSLGQVANIEFSTGSLGTARPWQFEPALPNAGPTRFERRQILFETQLCYSFYWTSVLSITLTPREAGTPETYRTCFIPYPVPMRAVPTLTVAATSGAQSISAYGSTTSGTSIFATATSTSAACNMTSIVANAEI